MGGKRAKRALTTLSISTYEPGKYVLVNTDDGTVWRGTPRGLWTRLHDISPRDREAR